MSNLNKKYNGQVSSNASKKKCRDPIMVIAAIFFFLLGLADVTFAIIYRDAPPAPWEDPDFIGFGHALRFLTSIAIGVFILKMSEKNQ